MWKKRKRGGDSERWVEREKKKKEEEIEREEERERG